MNWLIDTDILIDHLRDFKQASLFLKQSRRQGLLWVSVISIAEIYAGQTTRNAKEARKIRHLLNLFRVAYLDEPIAADGGVIVRDYGIALPDALIAATALQKRLCLATRNLRHFAHIPNLTVQQPF